MNNIASMTALLAFCLFFIPHSVFADESPSDSGCSSHLRQRSTAEVLDAHLGAFQSGNAALLACDYADDAAFILPGNVAQGRTKVEATFASFFGLAGGNIQVTVTTLTIADEFALLEYSVTSNHITVIDGADSFVVRNGLIVGQTAHFGDSLIH
jgi:ketosteroid isomerase-like protein